MQIQKTNLAIFSPTGTTEQVIRTIAPCFPVPVNEIDLCDYQSRERKYLFQTDDLLIVGIPVYGGRIPFPARERLQKFTGNNTPAILAAVYGNREYEDALLELKTLLEERGFRAVAAGAFLAEHSIVRSIAAGRPDETDRKKIADFAQKAASKLEKIECISDYPELLVKGNFPYRDFSGVPFKPHATKACTECGVCAAKCPVGAIPKDSTSKTDKDRCISCMRCIKICPHEARKLTPLEAFMAQKGLEGKCRGYKEPEFFL